MPDLTKCLIFCLVLWTALASRDKKCRALVLAATTDRGAYHAGVFDALLKNAADPAEFQYDVVTGTSISALNAALIAKHKPGEEANAAAELLDLWTTLTRDKVYQFWAGGYTNGLLFKTSLVDSSPFANFLYNRVSFPFHRRLVIGATNADNGQFETFNETDLNQFGDIASLIMATTAIPLYFPPIKWKGNSYFDGSVIMSANIEDAVTRCLEMVHNESDIIIDIISTHNNLPEKVDTENALKVYRRALHIYHYNSENFYLYRARIDYPKVNFRYIIQPSEVLQGTFNPYSFDEDAIAQVIEIGQKDGANVLNYGKAGNGAEIIEQAVEWLHKNHGMFSKGMEKVKEIHKRLKEKQHEEIVY